MPGPKLDLQVSVVAFGISDGIERKDLLFFLDEKMSFVDIAALLLRTLYRSESLLSVLIVRTGIIF